MGRSLVFLGGPSVIIAETLNCAGGGRDVCQSEGGEASVRTQLVIAGFEWKEATSQGKPVTSRSWKRQENGFSPRAFNKEL